jgi:hypothetical protein
MRLNMKRMMTEQGLAESRKNAQRCDLVDA